MQIRSKLVALATLVVGAAMVTAAAAPEASAYPDHVRHAFASVPLDELRAVTSVSRTSAWAVGCQRNHTQACITTLIEHWNGKTWTTVPSPNPAGFDQLSAVAATSAKNAWAVGQNIAGTLALQWDGHSWQQVPTITPDNSTGELSGIAAITPKDIWAVGSSSPTTGPDTAQTLIEQWNGAAWLQVPSPNRPGTGDFLSAVTAISPDNVWAVGHYFTVNSDATKTLIEHWDGKTWTLVPSPNPGGNEHESILTAVSATGPHNIWAVGIFSEEDNLVGSTLIEHWNGSSWKVVPSPNPDSPSSDQGLTGVTAISPGNAWAIGNFKIVEHWNGTKWTAMPIRIPRPAGFGLILDGIAALSPTSVLAVGRTIGSPHLLFQTLIEHWNGRNWTRVPSPSP